MRQYQNHHHGSSPVPTAVVTRSHDGIPSLNSSHCVAWQATTKGIAERWLCSVTKSLIAPCSFCGMKRRRGVSALWLGWRVRRPLVKDDIFVGAAEELACNENFVQPMIYHSRCSVRGSSNAGESITLTLQRASKSFCILISCHLGFVA